MQITQPTAVAEASPPSRLTFARANPLEYAEEIKALFVAHERPEFPAFFDRTYPDVVANGASSWIGRDPSGRLCAHIAQFPRPFRLGERRLRGALLANLMVAKEHRTLWPALNLVRRMVGDARESGEFDFLFGDPNDAAQAILRAGGFHVVGALHRFVAPVSDARLAVDLGIQLYGLVPRFGFPTPLAVSATSAVDLPDGPDIVQGADARALSPVPQPAIYRHRLAGYPASTDHWYTFRRRGSPIAIGAALVRGPDANGLAVVGALSCTSLDLVGRVLATLIRALRRTGAIRRLELSVMGESRMVAHVRRAGFVLREERTPVVALPLTPLGTEAVAAVGAEWRLLPTDLDR